MTKEMSARLDDISGEIKNLGKAMLKIRFDDLRLTFSEQMMRAVDEYSCNNLRPEVTDSTSCSRCHIQGECSATFQNAIMDVTEYLKADQSDRAIELLDELEGSMLSDRPPCQDPLCNRNALLLLGKVKGSVELFSMIRERLSIPISVPLPAPDARFAPDQVALEIGPLANPKRLEIMEQLERQESTFSEIGRAVWLKTGHLQFHLRPLLEGGLIDTDGRGHAYRLTNKGKQALAGLRDMICRMGMT